MEMFALKMFTMISTWIPSFNRTFMNKRNGLHSWVRIDKA